MKKHTKYRALPGIAALALAMLVSSCDKDPQSPGYEYFPDMYRSPSLETNAMIKLGNDTMMANMLPPEGTIPWGYIPYPYPDSPMGDSLASVYWKSPVPMNDEVEAKGEVLYGKFCVHCHGDAGKGDGLLVSSGKFPNKPTDYTQLPGLGRASEGHLYHVVHHGRGMMGPHASLLSPEERWMTVRYVQKLMRGGVSHSEWTKQQANDTAKADTAAAKPAAKPAAK